MSTFNQGIPGVPTLINSSQVLLTGNATSANALTVRQFGTGNVFSAQTTSGTTALFVGANGNVGIGTTGPQTALDVYTGTMNAATVSSTTLYGALAGSNTVAASTVTATSLVGTMYGALAGSNTVAASTVTATSLVGTMYGVLAGSNTVAASTVSATSLVGTMYGVLAGSNTVAASTVTATSLVGTHYGVLAGSNTIAASTVTATSVVGTHYGVLAGSNTVAASTVTATTLTGAGSGITGLDMGNAGSGTLALARGGTGTTSAQLAMNALAGAVTNAQYLRGNGTNVVMAAISASDVPTLNQNTSGTAAGLSTTLTVASGGTGTTSAQSAMNALAGAVTNARYLRGNGTNVVMAAISASDVPTLNQNTTGSSGSCTGTANYANSAGSAPANGGTATSVSGGSVNATSCYSSGGFQHSYGANGLITGGLSYNGNIQFSYSGPRAADTIFFYTAGNSSYNAYLQAQLTGLGNFYVRGGYGSGGADYAELFEWVDGNPNNEDRVGYPVVLVDDKIAVATENSTDIIGVISNTPTVVGDGSPMHWHGKYLKDDFGRPMYDIQDRVVWNEGTENHLVSEPGLVIPPDATYFTDKVEVLNPLYDENIPYNPRDMRKEWGMVGLMGKIYMRKSQPSHPNWKCMKRTANSDLWFVR